jgi:hypothetical protein
MGQQANSKRNASLDEKKPRMEGRKQQNSPEARQIRAGERGETLAKGKTSGAFGKDNVANRNKSAGNATREGGGGGGGATTPAAASAAGGVGRSTRRARSR